MFLRILPLLAFAALASCSTSTDEIPADAGGGDASSDSPLDGDHDAATSDARDAADDANAGPCALDAASSLPGVTIHFTSTRCTFTLAEAAAGITIPYTVVVDADVPVINAPDPLDQSRRTDPGTSGLHVFEVLSGGAQRYCLCDTGLPAPTDGGTGVTLKKGTYALDFTWDGKNWGGPSDTSQPRGAAFPAGSYRLEARARGSVTGDAGASPFVVAAAFRVTLTP